MLFRLSQVLSVMFYNVRPPSLVDLIRSDWSGLWSTFPQLDTCSIHTPSFSLWLIDDSKHFNKKWFIYQQCQVWVRIFQRKSLNYFLIAENRTILNTVKTVLYSKGSKLFSNQYKQIRVTSLLICPPPAFFYYQKQFLALQLE